MGVFFLVLFNYVFGGAIGAGTGVDYIEFLVPGVLVITALQGLLTMRGKRHAHVTFIERPLIDVLALKEETILPETMFLF